MPAANSADGAPLWEHNLGGDRYGFHPYGRDVTGGCDWQVGLNANGSPITGFYVTTLLTTSGGTRNYRLVNNDASVGTLTTNRLILTKEFLISTGASVDVYYYYYVKPVNALGTGVESDVLGGGVSGAGGYCSYQRGSSVGPVAPGIPTAVAGNAKATVTISAPTTGSPPSSYTVTAYDSAGTNPISGPKTCTVTVPNTSCEVTGLTNGTTYTFKSTATNGLGTSTISNASTAVIPNTGAPTITNVTSSTADGSRKEGQTISVQVVFNEAVTVTETPQLTLETGATDRVVNYASGSGTNTLTFTYTIQANDTSGDLTYVATDSLALNGGTIKNSSTQDAVLTLPSPSAAGSLGANKSLIVDTAAPSAPSSLVLASSSDTGSSDSDLITKNTSLVVTGTAEANSIVQLYVGEPGVATGSTCTANGSGAFSCTTDTLTAGSKVITAKTSDSAGNLSSASSSITVTLDTTAPTTTATDANVAFGGNAVVQSTETGTVYLVNSSVSVSNLGSITGAADASWNSVSITAATTKDRKSVV